MSVGINASVDGLSGSLQLGGTDVVTFTAAGLDSSTASYQPAGGSAVTTTVQAKLRETVSVKDFGAVGDGVADDTAAITAALAAATSLGKTLDLGSGTFLVSSLVLLDGSRIRGSGVRKTIIQAKAGSSAALFTMQTGRYTNGLIESLSIFANPSNTGQHCFYLYSTPGVYGDGGMWYTVFRDLEIMNFSGVGLYLRGGAADYLNPHQFNHFENIRIIRGAADTSRCALFTGQVQSNTFIGLQADGVSMSVLNTTNIELSREFINSGVPGGALGGGTSSGDNAPGPNTFIRAVSQLSDRGIYIDRAYANIFINPYFEAVNRVFTQETAAENNRLFNPNVQNCGASSGSIVGHVFNNGTTSKLFVDGGTYTCPSLNKLIISHSSGSTVFTPGVIISGGAYTSMDGMTSGMTRQVGPGATGIIDFGNSLVSTAIVNSTATPVATIKSMIPVGGFIALTSWVGDVTYSTGGNLSMNNSNTFHAGQTAVFVRYDLGTTLTLVNEKAPNGQLTLSAAAAFLNVADSSVKTTSKIFLMARNGSAASLMGSAKSLNVSAINNGSFQVITANGANPVGTELFDYVVIN